MFVVERLDVCILVCLSASNNMYVQGVSYFRKKIKHFFSSTLLIF